MRNFRSAGITIFVLLTFGSLLSYGATLTVTKTADTNDGICDTDCSLREAVATANDTPTDDEIRFSGLLPTPTVVELTLGEISIVGNGSLSIVGTESQLTTISGSNRSRIFFLRSTLTLSNLSLKQGNAVGAQFSGHGGAIALYGGRLTVNNCAFSGNSAIGNGGAIHDFYLATVIVSNSIFHDNRAANGGSVFVHGSSITVSDSTFTSNFTSGAGGSLYIYSGSTPTPVSIQNSTFADNSATAGGGLYSNLSVNVSNSQFTHNIARTDSGGAIHIEAGTFDITDSQVSSNTANFAGGGIYLYFGGTVRRCLIRGNSTNGDGGGIANYFRALMVEQSVIAGNTADTGGGIRGGGTIINSSIEGNTATDIGGGIYGGGTITNSTISGNTAGGDGGGIRGGGTFTNVTLVNNRATSGAGVFTAGIPLSAKNSIFANNTTYISTQEDVFGTLNSQGYNLIKSTLAATITGDTSTNITGVDPLLFPLTRGDTPNFHGLSPNSPAVDKGSSSGTTTDQRGLARPFDFASIANAVGGDGADIGAVERQTTDSFGYEADLGTRPTGDGVIMSNDVFLLRQIVLGNLSIDSTTNEFQRADCAPIATRGDGVLNSADVVQVRRFALGIDPIVSVGGPFSQASKQAGFGWMENDSFFTIVQFQITSQTASRGDRVSLPVELITDCKIGAVAFTVDFDPATLLEPRITAPRGINVSLNTQDLGKGKIGVLVDSDKALASATDRRIMMIEFTVARKAESGNTPISFGRGVVAKSVSSTKAEDLRANWIDGYVAIP